MFIRSFIPCRVPPRFSLLNNCSTQRRISDIKSVYSYAKASVCSFETRLQSLTGLEKKYSPHSCVVHLSWSSRAVYRAVSLQGIIYRLVSTRSRLPPCMQTSSFTNYVNQTHFHMKRFSSGLVLKQDLIVYCIFDETPPLFIWKLTADQDFFNLLEPGVYQDIYSLFLER